MFLNNLFSLLFILLFCYISFAEDDFDEKYRNAFDEEPEEITLHVDELKDWIGTDPEAKKRDELHAVGMCWQSEMARCVNDCSNSTLNIEFLQEICASYCQADVTWMCTKINLEYGGTEIFKFAGRWPFYRVFCFNEFGSVLFCSISVIIQALLLLRYITKTDIIGKKEIEQKGEKYPFRFLWISSYIIWMIVFTCATIFHTVDIQITEYIDYFSAMGASLFGLWLAIIRVFNIKRASIMWILSTPFIGFYGFHIMRMVVIRFSYGYNMRANIFIISIQAFLWISFCLLNFRKLPHGKWMLFGYFSLFCFVPLEIYDRPPWFGIIDTHALWHLSTNVVFIFWNNFCIKDTLLFYKTTKPKKTK